MQKHSGEKQAPRQPGGQLPPQTPPPVSRQPGTAAQPQPVMP